MPNSSVSRPAPSRIALALMLSWLIPGAGFMLFGRWARGTAHFVTIGLTFGLGLALHGSVLWPTWSVSSEEFNLINNFTFVTQMGSGLPAVASFLVSRVTNAEPGAMSWLGGIQSHTNFELGSYYLIVAGALNYFAIGNLYDRLSRAGGESVEADPA